MGSRLSTKELRTGSLMVAMLLGVTLSRAEAQGKRVRNAPTPVAEAAPAPEAPSLEATSSGEPSEYRPLVERGLAEYEAKNYEEARSLLYQAHTVFPNARTYRGLGMVEYELRNYGESIKQLEAALASDVRPLEGVRRTETEQLLERALGFVARVTVNANPSPSRLVVDGVPVEVPAGEALMLRVGEHLIELQAPGYITEKRAVSVKGGEQTNLTIVLRKPVEKPTEEKPKWVRNPWLWTAVGVVVAGTAVGLGVGLKGDSTTEPAYGGTSGQTLTGP